MLSSAARGRLASKVKNEGRTAQTTRGRHADADAAGAGPAYAATSTIGALIGPAVRPSRGMRGRGSPSTPDCPDEVTMEIRFPADAPAYRDFNLTLVFPALVDGERVPCAISVEALEDHFGADANDTDGWRRAFDAGRERIEAVAREHLLISNGTPVLLKSGHFPPGNLAST
jgi:hypothetical protein